MSVIHVNLISLQPRMRGLMSKIIRLVDRSRCATDWTCPRKRYWNYEHLGRGITKSTTSLALFTGIVTHDSLAAIATYTQRGEIVPIDTIANLAYKQIYDNLVESSGDIQLEETIEFAKEQASLTEGMIRGFYRQVWPSLMAQYPKIVAIEAEMEYELLDSDDLQIIFMTKPDLILEDHNGDWTYIEYKTTSSKKAEWISSWDTAVQLHSSVKATAKTLGKEPIAVQIIGLYKGYISYNRQQSPYCYVYTKKGNPPFTEDQTQCEFKAGFKRVPTWELPGGVKDWVNSMSDSVLANQFPMTAPIYVNEDLVKSFFNQRLIREREIVNDTAFNDDIDLDFVFPQKFDACQPAFGFGCEFKKLCFSHVVDPLTEGYQLRVPHHQRELEQFNG